MYAALTAAEKHPNLTPVRENVRIDRVENAHLLAVDDFGRIFVRPRDLVGDERDDAVVNRRTDEKRDVDDPFSADSREARSPYTTSEIRQREARGRRKRVYAGFLPVYKVRAAAYRFERRGRRIEETVAAVDNGRIRPICSDYGIGESFCFPVFGKSADTKKRRDQNGRKNAKRSNMHYKYLSCWN